MRLWMFGSDVGGGDGLEKHLFCVNITRRETDTI